MNPYKPLRFCRLCFKSQALRSVMDLGQQAFMDYYAEGEVKEPTMMPLRVVMCMAHLGGCGLAQLDCTLSPHRMYNQYWYRCISGSQKLFAKVGAKLVHRSADEILSSLAPVEVPCVTDEGLLVWRKILARQKSRGSLIRTAFSTGASVLSSPTHRWCLTRPSNGAHFARQSVGNPQHHPYKEITTIELRPGDRIPLVTQLTRPPECIDTESIYTYDTGYLIGVYIAEGSRNEADIRLTVHCQKDQDMVERVAQFVSGRLQETTRLGSIKGQARNVYLRGHVINAIINKFTRGRYSTGYHNHSQGKRLTDDVWAQPAAFLEGILDGWLDGDAHRESDQRWTFNIGTNQDLIEDLALICLLLGFPMRYRRITRDNRRRERESIHGWISKSRDPEMRRQSARWQSLSLTSVLVSKAQPSDGHQLWDIDVGGNGLFMLASGIVTHNSGVSRTMRDALRNVAESAMSQVELHPGDVVLDIGANDATLLDYYPSCVTKVGFEPSNLAKLPETTMTGASMIIRRLFNYWDYAHPPNDSLGQAWTKLWKAKVITSIAMFYDVDRPLDFLADLKECLDDDGIWINQLNYVPEVMKARAFDFVSHEHVTYWTLRTLHEAYAKVGLQIVDAETLPLNGGTVRVYARHADGQKPTERLLTLLDQERDYNDGWAWQKFSNEVQLQGEKLRTLLKDLRTQGKTIWAFGASTRGNTLLQAWQLGAPEIPCVADADPRKHGKYTIATNMKIVSLEEMRATRPDYALTLPYSYTDEIVRQETAYLAAGGKFIMPLPEVKVL